MNPTLSLLGNSTVPLSAGASGKSAPEDTAASVAGTTLFAGLMAGQDNPLQTSPGTAPAADGAAVPSVKVAVSEAVVLPGAKYAPSESSPGIPTPAVATGEAPPAGVTAPATSTGAVPAIASPVTGAVPAASSAPNPDVSPLADAGFLPATSPAVDKAMVQATAETTPQTQPKRSAATVADGAATNPTGTGDGPQAATISQSAAPVGEASTAVPEQAEVPPLEDTPQAASRDMAADVASTSQAVDEAPAVAAEHAVTASPRPDVDAAYVAQKPTTLPHSLQLRDLRPSPGNLGSGHAASTTAARVTSQVLRAVGPAVLGGEEQLTIQLDPEELGRVEVRFHATGNRLAVAIIASGAEAERMLREGVKELSDVIAQRSARFQTVDVRVESREQENRQDTRQDERREETSRGSGRDDGDGRRKSGKQPRTTAEAWADLALGG